MNLKKLLLSVAFTILANAVFAKTTPAYVSVWSGAKVFEKRNSQSLVLVELKYGDKVSVLQPDVFMGNIHEVTVQLEKNQFVKSRWLYVEVKTDGEPVYGYVPEAFLHIGNIAIPPHALYYYYSMSAFTDSVTGFHIYYTESPDRFKRLAEQQDPYEYNQPNESEANMRLMDRDGERSFNTGIVPVDTLKHYFKLELVEDISPYISRSVKSRYPIDTAHIERVLDASPNTFAFSLPIRKGKDSIVMRTNPNSDGVITYSYAGQIEKLNKYLICAAYDSPDHILYDKTTGQRQDFTQGFPYISPNGQYVVDYYETFGFEDDPSCSLRISRLDKHLKIISYVSVDFKSWLPLDGTSANAFWISDRELIIPVYSVYRHIHDATGEALQDSPVQYIKLTIR